MKPRFTQRALRQVAEIKSFIAKDNPQAAEAVARRISAVADLVAIHPSMGCLTDFGEVRVFRASPYPYLVFYAVGEREVAILRVRHTSRGQDWRSGL
jgi:addiction module RelE/StbE family toxin